MLTILQKEQRPRGASDDANMPEGYHNPQEQRRKAKQKSVFKKNLERKKKETAKTLDEFGAKWKEDIEMAKQHDSVEADSGDSQSDSDDEKLSRLMSAESGLVASGDTYADEVKKHKRRGSSNPSMRVLTEDERLRQMIDRRDNAHGLRGERRRSKDSSQANGRRGPDGEGDEGEENKPNTHTKKKKHGRRRSSDGSNTRRSSSSGPSTKDDPSLGPGKMVVKGKVVNVVNISSIYEMGKSRPRARDPRKSRKDEVERRVSQVYQENGVYRVRKAPAAKVQSGVQQKDGGQPNATSTSTSASATTITSTSQRKGSLFGRVMRRSSKTEQTGKKSAQPAIVRGAIPEQEEDEDDKVQLTDLPAMLLSPKADELLSPDYKQRMMHRHHLKEEEKAKKKEESRHRREKRLMRTQGKGGQPAEGPAAEVAS